MVANALGKSEILPVFTKAVTPSEDKICRASKQLLFQMLFYCFQQSFAETLVVCRFLLILPYQYILQQLSFNCVGQIFCIHEFDLRLILLVGYHLNNEHILLRSYISPQVYINIIKSN